MNLQVRFNSVLIASLACATGCSFLASGVLDKASSDAGQAEAGGEIDHDAMDAPPGADGPTSGSSSGSTSGSSSGSQPEAAPAEAGHLSCQTALTQLGQCMTYADFTAQTNGYSASDLTSAMTVVYGSCNACHNQGDGGFFIGSDPMVTFDESTQLPYILMWVGCAADAQGDFQSFVPSNVIFDAGAGCDAGTAPCHPAYTLPTGLIAAINAFVTESISRWSNGMCASPPADAGPG